MFSNSARTTKTHHDPALRERRYRNSIADVLRALRSITTTYSRWRFIAANPADNTVRLEHDTPILTFTDDITISMKEADETVIVSGYSTSRIGTWDLGVNVANLRELLRALDSRLNRIDTVTD